MAKQLKPYAIHQSGDWFTVMDSRTGKVASFPTPARNQAQHDCDTLNRAYAEALAEVGEA